MSKAALSSAVAELFGAERVDDPEVIRTLEAAARHLEIIAAIHIEPTEDGVPDGTGRP